MMNAQVLLIIIIFFFCGYCSFTATVQTSSPVLQSKAIILDQVYSANVQDIGLMLAFRELLEHTVQVLRVVTIKWPGAVSHRSKMEDTLIF